MVHLSLNEFRHNLFDAFKKRPIDRFVSHEESCRQQTLEPVETEALLF
jgi:hypothetical protein